MLQPRRARDAPGRSKQGQWPRLRASHAHARLESLLLTGYSRDLQKKLPAERTRGGKCGAGSHSLQPPCATQDSAHITPSIAHQRGVETGDSATKGTNGEDSDAGGRLESTTTTPLMRLPGRDACHVPCPIAPSLLRGRESVVDRTQCGDCSIHPRFRSHAAAVGPSSGMSSLCDAITA